MLFVENIYAPLSDHRSDLHLNWCLSIKGLEYSKEKNQLDGWMDRWIRGDLLVELAYMLMEARKSHDMPSAS